MALYLKKRDETQNVQKSQKPENPIIFDKHIDPNAQFTFVDFVPSFYKRTADNIILYHPFR